MTNLNQYLKMDEISKNSVLEAHKQEPRRKCFADKSGIRKYKDRWTFSVKIESAKKIFEEQTGLVLYYNSDYDNYWRYTEEEDEIEVIRNWEKNQGSLIYLHDCLTLSIAIESNFKNNTPGEYTTMGQLEYNGKHNHDQSAISQISDRVSDLIQHLPFYKDADLVCSVPSASYKNSDLPSSVTTLVSKKIGKQDVTAGFIFKGTKSSVKSIKYDEKWDVWEKAQVSFQNNSVISVDDKTIILIDDKYQSGVTIQYIAMKLQKAGAYEVYGLSFVKTFSDTDNTT